MAQHNSGEEKYIIEKENQLGKTVYHYCSLNTLLGILQNKELWFGCTASMNDIKEQRFFIEDLHKNIKDAIPTEKYSQCEDFFKSLYNSLNHDYPYAFCLSTLNDNAAQWERYADNACGISIGFNTKKLALLFMSAYMTFTKIHYGYDTKNHAHYQVLLKYILENELSEGFQNIRQIKENILACAVAFKHESFSTENECRISTIWSWPTMKGTNYEYKLINNTIKKILTVNLKNLCKKEDIEFEDLIDSITIGPRSKQSVYELQEYLKQMGFKKLPQKVSKSNCPLR